MGELREGESTDEEGDRAARGDSDVPSAETAWWQGQLGLCVAVSPRIRGSSQG